ncbi:MAG TPA: crossover junction endodeoxyribonuclease RuvC [Proteobacteria bacterium]|nr:crossover junction endodeoxyribonuclease RuvC [Pseudomonadota bacterium]
MLVLGVDPGSMVTGYGLVERKAGCYNCLYHEELNLPVRADVGAKLALIFDHTTQLLHEFRPEMVAVEGVFFGSNVKSMLVLGQARGAVMVASAKADKAIYEYAPALVKQAVTGCGRAGKEQVQQMVKILLRLDQICGEHAADALAVALCHLQQIQYRPGEKT